MLHFCVSKKSGVDFVVVHRTDRLARNLDDHVYIRGVLRKVGVEVVSVQEDFDDSAAGRLMENIVASLAQFDNDVRSARTLEGMRSGAEQGRWMWGAPIRYRDGGRHASPSLVPDPH